METQEYQIRAKKISELDSFNRQIDEYTYLIIGYNNGSVKQNYKITLSDLVSLIRENVSIDDAALLSKLNMFIDNEQIHIPTGSQGPQGAPGKDATELDIDFSAIQNQIDDLYRIVNQYHNAYLINYNLDHITPHNLNPTGITYGSTLILYFIPDSGYKMPNIVGVNGCEFTYDKLNKSIIISNPYSNVDISISAIEEEYAITYNLDHISSNELNPILITYGHNAILYFIPNTGYNMPSSVDIEGCEYTYDKENKSIEIFNPTSNVTINVIGERKEYSINYNLENITSNASNPVIIKYGETAILSFTPKNGYEMPTSVTVRGCSHEYNIRNKTIYISNINSNINIDIVGKKTNYTITYNLNHVSLNGLYPSTITYDNEALISFNTDTGYKMPNSITVTGCSYDYDIENKSIEISNATSNITINVTATKETYPITYNLENITSKTSNPSFIEYGNTITLSFNTNDGYKMPNSVTVEGCQYSYNNISKSITISNPTTNIVISIIGEKDNYIITYNFNNIDYQITNNSKSSYQIGETINLTLTAPENYKLPSSLNYSNCNINYQLSNGNKNASLTIMCNGKGPMSISGNGIYSVTYYFGYIKADDSSNIRVTKSYYTNGQFKGLQSVEVLSTSKLSSSVSSCPFNVNSTLTLNNIGYDTDIILLVPATYFNISENAWVGEFKPTSSQTYNMYAKSFTLAPISFPYYCKTSINGISYYALLMKNQNNGAEYIYKI